MCSGGGTALQLKNMNRREVQCVYRSSLGNNRNSLVKAYTNKTIS